MLVLPALAQDSTVSDDDVNAVAGRLYCPVCENIPLDACGTAACAEWRDEIRVQLEQGRTPQQVVERFVAQFGEAVVGSPQDPTLSTLSLLTPFLIGGVGLIVGVITFLRWRSGAQNDHFAFDALHSTAVTYNGQPRSDDDYRARIERDLLERR
ncbi:MAG: cytochrome c-type biogenesis protein CcmH [Burkholderiales bacterium]|nr:cytochrome c-type biogenesis protein CcmH [Anaerolineae bacterium]